MNTDKVLPTTVAPAVVRPEASPVLPMKHEERPGTEPKVVPVAAPAPATPATAAPSSQAV